MSEEIWNQQEKEIIEEIENNQIITTNDIFYWCKKAVKEGTPNLLQYLSNLSQKLFSLTLPSLFANALKSKLNGISEIILFENVFSSLLEESCFGGNNENIDCLLSLFRGEELNGLVFNSLKSIFPSCSLKLIERLIEKEVHIFNIKENANNLKFPKILLQSFMKQKIVLKNKEEAKAQLELVKKVQSQCEIDLLNETEEMKNLIITLALRSLNFKIIKYFLSLIRFDIKKSNTTFGSVLGYVFKSIDINYKDIDIEEWRYLLKIIKYLVDQRAPMSKYSNNIFFYAIEMESLKMIKCFVSSGANINYTDKKKDKNINNVLLIVFNNIKLHGNSNIKKRINTAKYFMSIKGIDLLHQNDKERMLCCIL